MNANNMSNGSVIESTTEVRLFWTALIVADLIWITFFLIALLTFSFKWMVFTLTLNDLYLFIIIIDLI